MSQRREMAILVLVTVLAAAVSLWGVTQPWSVMVEAQPPPLPEREFTHTGWSGLTACGWVALASVGAVWASRGWWRRAVGVVLLLSGLVLAVGGAVGLVSATNVVGPLSTGVAGLVVALCGGAVALRSRRWPTMGMQYERSAPKNADMWVALDRGEDPTSEVAAGIVHRSSGSS